MRAEFLRVGVSVLVGVCAGLLPAGCCNPPPPADPIYSTTQYSWLKEVAADMEPVSKARDEYGTISMSMPLLAEPDPSFAFKLSTGADDYYQAARNDINGGSASSKQQSSVNSSGTTIQVDIQKLVEEGLATASGGATALLTAAKGPTTLPAISVNVLPTTQPATSALASDKFTQYMQLLKGTSPVLENRAAIITAAGDTATQAMLSFLAGPAAAAKFKDKKVLLGVSMVAVRPGSVTYRGYEASVAQTFVFGYRPVREAVGRQLDKDEELRHLIEARSVAQLPSDRSPLVAAVSPMTETQTLDLQSANRKRERVATQIAAALSGFGLGLQSQQFTDLVKQLESDVSTVSALNVVTSFAHGANVCGFSVTPRLRALADPSNQQGQSGAAMVVDPVSFPALVLVGIDADDLRILAVEVKGGQAKGGPQASIDPCVRTPSPPPTTREASEKEYAFYEPVLKVYQTTHWTPLPNANREDGGSAAARVTETERVAWAAHLLKAERALCKHVHDPESGGPDAVSDYLEQKMNVLGSETIHDSGWQNLPQDYILDASGRHKPSPIPQIDEMDAADLESAAAGKASPQTVWIIGTGFDSVDAGNISAVYRQGTDAASTPTVTVTNGKVVGKGAHHGASQAITFSITATGGKGHVPVVFQIPYRGADGETLNLLTPPIDVYTAEKSPAKSVVISRTRTRKDGADREKLTFPADTPLQAVHEFLTVPCTQPVGTGGELDVNVRAREAGH